MDEEVKQNQVRLHDREISVTVEIIHSICQTFKPISKCKGYMETFQTIGPIKLMPVIVLGNEIRCEFFNGLFRAATILWLSARNLLALKIRSIKPA